jgi:cell division septum initiation protein DivIVA
MDWNDIDRLREPGFTVARRGYDRREVDRLLASLVDWLETDAAKQVGELAVKRRLEFVGKSTARILLTTEEESEQLRRLTDEECEELRSEAETAALKARQAADDYAKQIVEDAERRRAEIEVVVSELEARRDRTIQELDRLRAELSSAIGTHESDVPSPKRNVDEPGDDAQPAKKAGAVAKA